MDTVVDAFDALLFLDAFPSSEGAPPYAPRLDFSPDAAIDIRRVDLPGPLAERLHEPVALQRVTPQGVEALLFSGGVSGSEQTL